MSKHGARKEPQTKATARCFARHIIGQKVISNPKILGSEMLSSKNN